MSYFEERLGLTTSVEEKITELFSNDVVQEFGCLAFVDRDTELFKFLSAPEINQMPAGMIIKFAPDFIILTKKSPQKIYFLDVKHSVSPIYANSRLELMRRKHKDDTLNISDVGVVAREALLSYRRYYPNTIILMSSPYNPKKVMAQFANDVDCLYCYRSTSPDYDCNDCPAKNGGFFDIERAGNSTGSQTPMTNIDLRSFEPVDEFFKKIGIEINKDTLAEIEELIVNEPICFDNKVSRERKQEVLRILLDEGCDWVKNELGQEVYTIEDNDFIHFDKNCFCIRNAKKNITVYANEDAARQSGKNVICKFCGHK